MNPARKEYQLPEAEKKKYPNEHFGGGHTAHPEFSRIEKEDYVSGILVSGKPAEEHPDPLRGPDEGTMIQSPPASFKLKIPENDRIPGITVHGPGGRVFQRLCIQIHCSGWGRIISSMARV